MVTVTLQTKVKGNSVKHAHYWGGGSVRAVLVLRGATLCCNSTQADGGVQRCSAVRHFTLNTENSEKAL